MFLLKEENTKGDSIKMGNGEKNYIINNSASSEEKEQKDTIKLHYQRNYYHVRFDSIEYIRAYSGEAEFKVDDHIMRKKISLSDMEKLLCDSIFFRINKSYIVNLLRIRNYKDGIIYIGDVEIPLARRKKKEFEKVYTNHKLKDCVVV